MCGVRFFLFTVSVLIAAVADWSFGYLLPSWFPPLPASAVLFWFLYFDLTAGIFAALGAGLALDSFYPVPFGAFTSLFVILVLVAQLLKIFVIQTSTLIARALVFGALLILGAVLLPSVIYIMERVINVPN